MPLPPVGRKRIRPGALNKTSPMINIIFSDKIRQAAPGVRAMAFTAEIDNAPTSDDLWQEILQQGREMQASMPIDQVNKQPAIRATRMAYKACGKEPNRYRPSAEALSRRVVKGMELYRTLMAIDLINLLSMRTGHSIGGFDADKVQGTTLELGVGREGEPFEAIGRGQLNIAGLPVYRDAEAAIGTPTSDCERTKLSPDTRRLLMIINVYDTEADMATLQADATALLEKYGAKITSVNQFTPC